MKSVKVTNCRECPFATNDNEYGYCACNVSDKVSDSLKMWEQLPSDNVHNLCPLKVDEVRVWLNDDK